MATPACEVLITEAPLDAPPMDVESAAGATIDFYGIVRSTEDEREILGIEYEAHREMAEHQLRKIAGRAAQDFGLTGAIVHHRIGFIAVGETSLFLRVRAPHRLEAFRASQWIVDQLKEKVPIWKKPRFAGTALCRGGAGSADETRRHSEAATAT